MKKSCFEARSFWYCLGVAARAFSLGIKERTLLRLKRAPFAVLLKKSPGGRHKSVEKTFMKNTSRGEATDSLTNLRR